MSPENAKLNPYMERVRKKFISSYEQMKQIEETLSADTIEDYGKAEGEVIKLASKLLEAGAFVREDGKYAVIFIEGEDYPILSKKLKEALGEDEYNTFLIQPDDNLEVDIDGLLYDGEDQEPKDRKAKDDWAQGNEVYNDPFATQMNNTQPASMYMNPLAAFMSYMMLPFAGMYQQSQMGRGEGDYSFQQKPHGAQTEEEVSDISKSLARVQKRISTLETEKKKAEKSFSLLAEKMKDMKASLEEKDKEISNALEKAKEAETIAETLKKESEDLKAQIKEQSEQNKNLQKSKEDTLREIDKTRKELEQAKKDINSLSDRLKEANEKLNDTRNTNKKVYDLENQLKVKDSQIEKKQRQLEELQAKNKKLNDDLEGQTSENERLKKKLEDNEAKSKQADTEKEAYYKNLENEIKRLKNLAYVDELTGASTSVALNERLSKEDCRSIVVSRIDVQGMREINATYRKEAGDRVLKIVSEELIKGFKRNSVYRIMGDNFIVIQKGSDDRNAKTTLSSIKKNLVAQSINIAYGVGVGVRCDSMKELMEACEAALNQMKQDGSIEPAPISSEYQEESEGQGSADDDDDDDVPMEVSLDDDILNNYNPD